MRHRVTTYHVITIYNGLRVCFSLLLERTAGYTFSLKQKYTKTNKKKWIYRATPFYFHSVTWPFYVTVVSISFAPPPVLTTM